MRAVCLAAWLAWFAPAGAAMLDVRVSTPGGRPVEDAAVVLEPLSGNHAKRAKAAIRQHDREFIPYLSIVQTGTAVDFPNEDPFKHHIYSFSPAKTFEVKLYAGKPEKPVVFDKPGEVVLGCNIHDWMEAYVLVVDTPYFAKTGADGRARVDGAPPGQYRLRLWHPRQSAAIAPRQVTLGQSPLPLALTMDVAPRVAKPKQALGEEGY